MKLTNNEFKSWAKNEWKKAQKKEILSEKKWHKAFLLALKYEKKN